MIEDIAKIASSETLILFYVGGHRQLQVCQDISIPGYNTITCWETELKNVCGIYTMLYNTMAGINIIACIVYKSSRN